MKDDDIFPPAADDVIVSLDGTPSGPNVVAQDTSLHCIICGVASDKVLCPMLCCVPTRSCMLAFVFSSI